MPSTPEPTEHDRKNARVRAEIAERQAEVYRQVLAWALGAFGPGWLPSHRHFLVERDEEARVRYTGEPPTASATVYTVRHEETGQARHFTVEDGGMVEHPSMEAAFGSMLLEPHPTRTIEVRGKRVHPHRYSLCWADFPLYEPKTAEQLAALRVSREQKRAEREDRKWAEREPLWAPLAEREKRERQGRGGAKGGG